MNKGIFIAFEGADGCGKSTAIEFAAKCLKDIGVKVVIAGDFISHYPDTVIRDIGATPLKETTVSLSVVAGEVVRSKEYASTTEVLVVNAARSRVISNIVAPALKAGYVVLYDRYLLSTMVYQDDVNKGVLGDLHGISTKYLSPDYTVLLHSNPSTALKRIKSRKDNDARDSITREEYLNISGKFFDLAETHGPASILVNESTREVLYTDVSLLMNAILAQHDEGVRGKFTKGFIPAMIGDHSLTEDEYATIMGRFGLGCEHLIYCNFVNNHAKKMYRKMVCEYAGGHVATDRFGELHETTQKTIERIKARQDNSDFVEREVVRDALNAASEGLIERMGHAANGEWMKAFHEAIAAKAATPLEFRETGEVNSLASTDPNDISMVATSYPDGHIGVDLVVPKGSIIEKSTVGMIVELTTYFMTRLRDDLSNGADLMKSFDKVNKLISVGIKDIDPSLNFLTILVSNPCSDHKTVHKFTFDSQVQEDVEKTIATPEGWLSEVTATSEDHDGTPATPSIKLGDPRAIQSWLNTDKEWLASISATLPSGNTIAEMTRLSMAVHRLNAKAGWWTNLETNKPAQRNIFEMLALVQSEVSEAVEAARKDTMDDHLTHRHGVEAELADTIIRVLDLCGALGIDIGAVIAEKLEYNTKREDHKTENRSAEGGKKA